MKCTDSGTISNDSSVAFIDEQTITSDNDVSLVDNPNTHHVEPHWRVLMVQEYWEMATRQLTQMMVGIKQTRTTE